jgi:hypothetical protein
MVMLLPEAVPQAYFRQVEGGGREMAEEGKIPVADPRIASEPVFYFGPGLLQERIFIKIDIACQDQPGKDEQGADPAGYT